MVCTLCELCGKKILIFLKKILKNLSILVGLALVLVGCQNLYVTCRSEYLYPQYLASERVNTPDPFRKCYYGQQVIVRWNLPQSSMIGTEPIYLRLQVRYGNREIETLNVPLDKRRGWKTHRLINQDYWCRGGILAFKAELIRNGEILDDWTHYLWVDVIEIHPD